eukprot:4762304-Pleurochrysis_carterae.AAC.1
MQMMRFWVCDQNADVPDTASLPLQDFILPIIASDVPDNASLPLQDFALPNVACRHNNERVSSTPASRPTENVVGNCEIRQYLRSSRRFFEIPDTPAWPPTERALSQRPGGAGGHPRISIAGCLRSR